MEIILEHESTEDDKMNFSDMSLKRKIMQCDDGEDSNTSQSSDAETYVKTAKKRQKKSKKAYLRIPIPPTY